MRWLSLPAVLLSVTMLAIAADPPKKITAIDPAEAGPDFAVQGEYEGEIVLNSGPKKVGAQVVAKGDGKFDVRLLMGGLPGAGWDGKSELRATATTADGKVTMAGKDFSGEIANGKLTGKDGGKLDFALTRVERKSPTLGAKPPEGAAILFDGTKSDFAKGKIVEVGNEKLLGVQKTGGLVSAAKFTNFTLHIEFRTPFMPAAGGQGRGNSGVYLQHHYECQVLDSFGLKGLDNECGGFYQQKSPDVNMCLPPLAWQTYDIEFTAAKFEDGKKVTNAVVTVKHNGVVIHDKVELKKETPGGSGGETSPGALHLQDHGDGVVFRNIWAVERK